MSQYGKLARSLSGVVVWGSYEVFFIDEKSARVCAEKYQGEVQQLDDGWLVKKKIEPVSDNDPIIEAIKRAIKEAGLTSD
jgi:hypothetical protein